ncbi:MAG: tetratricopeptide repeat protein [Candidatus Omnitrophica bacterium]|nr:tetratricopeptide repeat protein [Candidatus Omnitrophota bacterium]
MLKKIYNSSYWILFVSIVVFPHNVFAQDNPADNVADQDIVEAKKFQEPIKEDQGDKVKLSTNPSSISSEEYVRRAWEASSKSDVEKLDALVKECLFVYQEEAKRLHASLLAFPERSESKKYQVLNDVATCLFVRAEALMNRGQKDKAISAFTDIIEKYPWSQAWDPRGWYWSIKEKSEASINVMLGKVEEDDEPIVVNRTKPMLHTPGKEKIVDYRKYGIFENVGSKEYRYIIFDIEGLAAAVGEGIYPNAAAIYNNPRYKIVSKEGRLKGSHWDFVSSDDLEAAYFKWVTAPEPWGVRLFYVGLIFEKAHMYHEAIRSYNSVVVHFPKTVAWTYWQTPWYPGQAAIAKIKHLCRMHPELNLYTKHMKIQVRNGFDSDPKNDGIVTYPGYVLSKNVGDTIKDNWPFEQKSTFGKVKKQLGNGKVRLVQHDNGHWQLLVEDKPYIIKGLTYDPTRIGESPDKGTLENWMEQDTNGNGVPDGPFESWVDKNGNNKQDNDEPTVGDFQLMKEMGVNTIRFYHVPTTPNKEILRKLYEEYGIRVILGDFLGKYTVGSGADWFSGTDYNNAEHKINMLESVKKMVMEHKDEPYLLMWLLGNENNYGVGCNADKEPEAYFKFVNDVAEWIKIVDPNHPVALSNGDTLFLDIFAKHAPAVDIFAANVYRGDYGFGSYWDQVFEATGKAAFITEYGCPSYAKHLTLEEAEAAQAAYHIGNWKDIEENIAGMSQGTGNALGGVVFEWLDEWWKNYEPYRHDKKSDAIGPFPGGYYYEEWFGLASQGKGQNSPFLRQLRQSYFAYQDMWLDK